MPPQAPSAANAAKSTQNPSNTTTRYLRTVLRVVAALCTVTLSCLAVVWGIKSYNATQFGNLLQQQESCRQHPRDVVLQAKPICQEMRKAEDFDPLSKRDNDSPRSTDVLIPRDNWSVLYGWLKQSVQYLYRTCGRYVVSFCIMRIMPPESRWGRNWKIRFLGNAIILAGAADIVRIYALGSSLPAAIMLWFTFMLVHTWTVYRSSTIQKLYRSEIQASPISEAECFQAPRANHDGLWHAGGLQQT
ncbi:hypothetical protein BKA63DRAFT_516862 [Paraphoma chrysanthemicola]|nr:hypothetical protein BKA63DRAFT_516862 [Paraphoma chrysanthemicola]